MEQTWNSYINSLNQNSLPRQVEVTDGNYLSGSLHDLSFSKGDIITVVDLMPSQVVAEVNDGKQVLGMVDIPLEYKGKFQLIADSIPFETVADLVRSVQVPQDPTSHGSPPCFQNLVPIFTEVLPVVLWEKERLSLVGFEESQGKRLLRCEVLGKSPPLRLLLPMGCRGHFQECQDDQFYSMDTIVKWKLLAGRQRRIRAESGRCLRTLSPLIPKHFRGHLVLHPFFSVTAHLPGDNQIIIPSDLDIHVTDRTGLESQPFKVMTIRQIYGMEKNKFPLRIKIMSVALAGNKMGTKLLRCGQFLTILRTEEVKKFTALEISQGKKKGGVFLIPCTYQGRVLRKGRYFNSVADVALAKARQHGQLCFQSRRDYFSHAKPFSSFKANECFLALKKSVVSNKIEDELHRVEALKCLNIATNTHVKLPLFAEGDFRELVEDAGPGTLQELCPITRLPCHIKVVSPDPSMAKDPLYGTEELRVENVIVEQCLIAKYEISPEDKYTASFEDIYTDWSETIFEIPIEKSSSEVLVVEEQSWMSDVREEGSMAPQYIEEITEADYLTFSNYLIVPHPPPCPPKPRSLS